MLPAPDLGREWVEFDGHKIECHGLTRGQVVKVHQLVDKKDVKGAEIWIIACGTDNPEAEVRDWYDEAPSGFVQVLIDAINRQSSLSGEARKSDEAPVHEG